MAKPTQVNQPIRVACVGDSITYGAGIMKRKENSYPAQLGKMLGPTYTVHNFGVNSATLLKLGNKPYWHQKAFRSATKLNPQIVIIKLGSNDVKPRNWKHSKTFEADLKSMILHFQNLPSKPRVILGKPTFVAKDRWGITEQVVLHECIPIIEKVAKNLKLQLLDFHTPLLKHKELFPDGVHPNTLGAQILAKTAYTAILTDPKTAIQKMNPLRAPVRKKPTQKIFPQQRLENGT